jgi:hypothetical protein
MTRILGSAEAANPTVNLVADFGVMDQRPLMSGLLGARSVRGPESLPRAIEARGPRRFVARPVRAGLASTPIWS